MFFYGYSLDKSMQWGIGENEADWDKCICQIMM